MPSHSLTSLSQLQVLGIQDVGVRATTGCSTCRSLGDMWVSPYATAPIDDTEYQAWRQSQGIQADDHYTKDRFRGLKVSQWWDAYGCFGNDAFTVEIPDAPNFTPIYHVKTLMLWKCTALVRTPELHGVERFSCSYSPNLVDVSSLRGVASVTVNNCASLVDVSPLGDAASVSIAECPLVADVSPLHRVATLELRACPGVTDVSGLLRAAVPALSDGMAGLSLDGGGDREPVSRVQSLWLVGMHGIADLAPFRVYCPASVVLDGCPGIVDVSPLAACTSVVLCKCPGVVDVAPLANVRELVLSGLPGVERIPTLTGRIHSLSVVACDALDSVEFVAAMTDGGSLKRCVVAFCNRVTNVAPLARVDDLTIHACSAVVDVSPLANVRALTLMRFPVAVDVGALAPVESLRVSWCTVHNVDPDAPGRTFEACVQLNQTPLAERPRDLYVHSDSNVAAQLPAAHQVMAM